MNPSPVDILERDWQRELASGALTRRLQRWRELEPALWPFTRPAPLVRYLGRSTPAASKDMVLCALLRRAREDPAAARLVLGMLLPALKRRMGRVLIDVDEREELWSAVLYRLWQRIRGYPIGRLSHHVAANLALTAVRDELEAREKERRLARRVIGECPPEPADRDAAESDIDALLKRAVWDGAITEAEAELIVCTRIDGVSLVDYASAEGRAYDALRLARRRAERRLLLYLGAGDLHRRVFGSGGQIRLSVVLGSSGEGPAGLSGEKTNRHP